MTTTNAMFEALDNVDEAIAIYDADDRLAAFNSRYREWRSVLGGDIKLGVPWLDIVRESIRCGTIPEAKGREEQWLKQRCKTRGAYSIVRKLADGRAFKVNERRMTSGEIAVVWTNVTELIEAQETRSRDLENDQQRLAKLGMLVAQLAHDFNNALQGVVGSLELLSKRLPADDGRNSRLLGNATLSARYGMATAEQLLAVIRKKPSKQSTIDIGATIENLSDVLRNTLSSSTELRIAARPATFFAFVDPLKLEAAVINLVLNARDAIKEAGSIVISLDYRSANEASELASRDYVVLAVTDTGIGMDQATLARASEPLFTTKEKGTGLGLTAVKSFSQSVGGTLVLHSSLGMGTSVELWLPASHVQPD